jgi:hypothetical protein
MNHRILDSKRLFFILAPVTSAKATLAAARFSGFPAVKNSNVLLCHIVPASEKSVEDAKP